MALQVATYTIRKSQRVQNNAARIVLQTPRRSRATPLLNTLHWLPVQQRILQGGSADVQGPQHIDTVLPPSPTPGLRGRPQSATMIGHSGAVPTIHQDDNRKRAFRCTAPAIWNSLPKTVLTSISVTCFKSRLNTHLFSQAFSHTSTNH